MNSLLHYAKKYRKEFIIAILCIEAETVFELIIPMIMADIIDVGVANGNRSYILMKGGQMIAFAATALLLGHVCARFTAICGNGIGAEIRKAEFKKMQTYSFANTDHFSTSSLVTRLTSDVTTIQNSITNGMRPGFRSPVMMLTALVVSFRLNARLAMVFFIAAPLLAVILILIIKNVRPLYGRMQGAMDLVNRTIQENLRAVRVVKAYVRGDYETEKFGEVNDSLKNASERSFSLAALNMPAMQFVMYGTILSILWFGGNLVIGEGMKVGALTSFLSYVLQVLNSLMMFSNVFLLFTRSLTSWRRISEVLVEEPAIRDDQASDIEITQGSICFDHVYFKYKDTAKEYVLSDISFQILPGQTIGIIGQTGAAKSTLVQLIQRLYEINSGEILIDDQPIRHYTQDHLREAIGMVLQKNTLFSGTVKENICWGKENASDEEITEACRIACVDEFIDRLDNGYDTVLGQGGVNLSGGQKQRLCIARAVLKKPRILILDDSTSALDTATEQKINEALKESLPDMTKIIISQRISSVSHGDQIIVLGDGRVNAAGTHEELLENNEIYRDIFESQQKGGGLSA
ncbi:ABC transporter ATP-binding protein [Clostridium boliviensis]|uniref:ABC transporter ATP-binding protein n=1 Tax=Clostridium boliviensis TaxID=318465 RepID=A0ABU4GJ75_9CLOT|nr:ABC transporter ATP-binding protein [Clostridium boliviensis]MDW2796317.1 ABC transporter ATP-binding protein [Clostridium boliviensis]